MTVNYYENNGRVHFATDRSMPKGRGKFIAGFANSVEAVRQSVRRYCGNGEFTLVRVSSISLHNAIVVAPATLEPESKNDVVAG